MGIVIKIYALLQIFLQIFENRELLTQVLATKSMTIYYSEQNRPDKSLCVNVLRNCCRNTRIYQIARTKSENLLESSLGSASYKNSVAHIKKGAN